MIGFGCGFVPSWLVCVLPVGEGRLAGSVDLCSSVLLSVLVLVQSSSWSGRFLRWCSLCVAALFWKDALFGHAP